MGYLLGAFVIFTILVLIIIFSEEVRKKLDITDFSEFMSSIFASLILSVGWGIVLPVVIIGSSFYGLWLLVQKSERKDRLIKVKSKEKHMSKFTSGDYFRLVAIVILLVGSLGFLAPYLISAKSTLFVLLGASVFVVVPWITWKLAKPLIAKFKD